MYIRKLLAVGALAFAFPAGAVAQETGGALCHHAGLTYSPGSYIRMGQAMLACDIDAASGVSKWVAVSTDENTAASANCISGGREFGHGTVLLVGATELSCSRGIWYKSKE